MAVGSTAAALIGGGAMAAGLSTIGHGPGSSAPASASSSCTSDTLQVGYRTELSPASQSVAVTDVTLSDTAAAPNLGACVGASYRVTLLDAGGASLGEVGGMVPGGTASFSPATGFTSPVDVARIAGVTVALGG